MASDFASSLPVRTENNGDVVVKVVDGTLTSQTLGVDSTGRVTVKLDDAAGNGLTSQVNGAQRALDVGIDVAGVQIDPRQVRALTSADVVSVVQSTTPWVVQDAADGSVAAGTAGTKSSLGGLVFNTAAPTLTNAQQVALQGDAAGNLKVNLVTPIPTGTNSIGNIGTVTTVTAVTAITNALPAGANNIGSVNQGTSPWITSDLSDGSSTGGTAGTKSALGGGIFNTVAPTLTNGQQAGLQLDSSGNLKVDLITPVPAGTNLIGGTNVYVGGALATVTNPVPVVMTTNLPGTLINKYNTTVNLAAAGSANHDYTVTTAKTFSGKKFFASGSGKIRADVKTSPDGTTFTTLWTAFNSTATPNISIDLDLLSITDTGTGAIVRITIVNDDKSAFDVFSTISGVEN